MVFWHAEIAKQFLRFGADFYFPLKIQLWILWSRKAKLFVIFCETEQKEKGAAKKFIW